MNEIRDLLIGIDIGKEYTHYIIPEKGQTYSRIFTIHVLYKKAPGLSSIPGAFHILFSSIIDIQQYTLQDCISLFYPSLDNRASRAS